MLSKQQPRESKLQQFQAQIIDRNAQKAVKGGTVIIQEGTDG